MAKSYPTLCDRMDSGPSGSSVHGIYQARTLEWVAPGIDAASPVSPALVGRLCTTEPPGKPVVVLAVVVQSLSRV